MENNESIQEAKSSKSDKKATFGCLGVIIVIIACLFYIFKGPTEADQQWGKKVKANVPAHWEQISERDSTVTMNNPLTWGDKGIGQIRYLVDAKKINEEGDWLLELVYVRRKAYEYDLGEKTNIGFISREISIMNFDKMEVILDIDELPKYRDVEKFTESQARQIIREEKFLEVKKMKRMVEDIHEALERRLDR